MKRPAAYSLGDSVSSETLADIVDCFLQSSLCAPVGHHRKAIAAGSVAATAKVTPFHSAAGIWCSCLHLAIFARIDGFETFPGGRQFRRHARSSWVKPCFPATMVRVRANGMGLLPLASETRISRSKRFGFGEKICATSGRLLPHNCLGHGVNDRPRGDVRYLLRQISVLKIPRPFLPCVFGRSTFWGAPLYAGGFPWVCGGVSHLFLPADVGVCIRSASLLLQDLTCGFFVCRRAPCNNAVLVCIHLAEVSFVCLLTRAIPSSPNPCSLFPCSPVALYFYVCLVCLSLVSPPLPSRPMFQ